LGPMHDFLVNTYRRKNALSASTSSSASGSSGLSASQTLGGRSRTPSTPPRPYTPLTPNTRAKQQAQAQAAASAAASAAAAAAADPLVAVDKVVLPALHLDQDLALSLRPIQVQTVGGMFPSRGTDPITKYRFPQTASQVYGWQTAKRYLLITLTHSPHRQGVKRGVSPSQTVADVTYECCVV
jgi:hypothetical protein